MTTDYQQRIVMGTTLADKVFTEYDIPTRNGQVVNFRVFDQKGEAMTGNGGMEISSPIKEDVVIDLLLETGKANGQNVPHKLTLKYESPNYGDENKELNSSATVADPTPDTLRTKLFIGSYEGGCIKLVNWQAN